MIYMPSRTDQIASAIIDGRLLPWQHFNSQLDSGLPSMMLLPHLDFLNHCHMQQNLSVNNGNVFLLICMQMHLLRIDILCLNYKSLLASA